MILNDQFIIAVDSVYDEVKNEAGIIGLNTVHYFEGERDRSERKLRVGTIHSAPEGYSEKKHMPIDPGYPNHRMFISHDAIQRQVNLGYKWDESYYHPGAKEELEFITIAQYGAKITAQAGDKIYFHPMVTEPEKFMGMRDGKKLYLAEVHELVCVVRDGWLIPQGGYILVDPIQEDNEVRGLLTSIDKKDVPLRGIVKYAHEDFEVNPGDEVMFQENANWDFIIEGRRYFAMLEEDVFMRKVCTQ